MNEITLWLCDVTQEPVALQTCLACSRTQGTCRFTYPILQALAETLAEDEGLTLLHHLGQPIIRVTDLVG